MKQQLISRKDILAYEVHSSWWAGLAGLTGLRELAASWFAWKVRRKYRRYEASLRESVQQYSSPAVRGD